MHTTFKGASGLFEILQSEQLRGYVRELVVSLLVESAYILSACYQVKLVHHPYTFAWYDTQVRILSYYTNYLEKPGKSHFCASIVPHNQTA
jgi:hypothetical protein